MPLRHSKIIHDILRIVRKRRANEERWGYRKTRDFAELLDESIEKLFLERDGVFWKNAEDRLKVFDSLIDALARHIVSHGSFDPEDEDAPEGQPPTIETVREWLDTQWELAKGYITYKNNYFEMNLANLIEWTEEEVNSWLQADKYLTRMHWNRIDETSSRLPFPTQAFVGDLCQLWFEYVDPELGLPSRSSNPNNPLLKFVSTALHKTIGEETPRNTTLHTFIFVHLRPLILNSTKAEPAPKMPIADPIVQFKNT